jgi:RNA polymerase sigma factor (sigma-70 family)
MDILMKSRQPRKNNNKDSHFNIFKVGQVSARPFLLVFGAKTLKSQIIKNYTYPDSPHNRYISGKRLLQRVGPMEDKILVFRCKKGSKDALRRIYEKYRDYLLIVAVALSHNVNLAEDAVHDAFVGFAESLERFELTGSLKAYLATCVANRIRDLMRNHQNRAVPLEDDCPLVSDADEPGRTIICNEELQQLSSTLAKLPDEQREVIVLRLYGQMRFGIIAKSLNISVNTAKGRYRYGIEKLRSILDSEVQR